MDPSSIAVSMLAKAATGIATTAIGGAAQRSAAKQRLAMQQQQAARNIKIMEQQQAIREKQRKKQLKASLATQRARMGGSGVGSTTGSGSALLRGISGNAMQKMALDRHTMDIRKQDVQYGLAQAQYKNLLERKQQRNAPFTQALSTGVSAGINQGIKTIFG